MRIMVFDVAAESGGALSVLNEFYNECKLDKNNDYVFILSIPNLIEDNNIKVMQYPWIKKSWLHRLFFDNFIAPNLIKKFTIEKVISLQNIIVPHTKVKQSVYVHNSLPFIDHKFSLKEDKLLWAYQNIMSIGIYRSIILAEKVFVQTDWMKEKLIKKLKVDEGKVEVIPPTIEGGMKQKFSPNEKSMSTFFYPASEHVYKNHKVIVNACRNLKAENIIDYKVIFTLKGTENKNIINLFEEIKNYNLPIEFVGNLEREKVYDLYANSILLFPSYVESYGLPMHESRMHGGLIVASDCPFSHEILDNYNNSYFFHPFNTDQLSSLMKGILNGKIKYL